MRIKAKTCKKCKSNPSMIRIYIRDTVKHIPIGWICKYCLTTVLDSDSNLFYQIANYCPHKSPDLEIKNKKEV